MNRNKTAKAEANWSGPTDRESVDVKNHALVNEENWDRLEKDSAQSTSSSDEGEEDVRETLRKRLLAMKPEKVAELKVKLGEELFKKTFAIADSVKGEVPKTRKKKSSKRPREVSSKQPVSAFRRVVEVSKPKTLDPRFAKEAGEFDEVGFRRDYAFIDDLRASEIQELRRAHREASKAGMVDWKAERIKTNLLRLEDQQKAADAARLKVQLNAEVRAENIERMNRGERPIYLNNQQMRQQFLEKKAQQIKKRKRESRKADHLVRLHNDGERKPKLDPTKLS